MKILKKTTQEVPLAKRKPNFTQFGHKKEFFRVLFRLTGSFFVFNRFSKENKKLNKSRSINMLYQNKILKARNINYGTVGESTEQFYFANI